MSIDPLKFFDTFYLLDMLSQGRTLAFLNTTGDTLTNLPYPKHGEKEQP
jgi:hypothetical protein